MDLVNPYYVTIVRRWVNTDIRQCYCTPPNGRSVTVVEMYTALAWRNKHLDLGTFRCAGDSMTRAVRGHKLKLRSIGPSGKGRT